MTRELAIAVSVLALVVGSVHAADVNIGERLAAMKAAKTGLPMSKIYSELGNLIKDEHLPLLEREIMSVKAAVNQQYGLYCIYLLQRRHNDESTACLKRITRHPIAYLAGRAASTLSSRKEMGWLKDFFDQIVDEDLAQLRRIQLLGTFNSIRDIPTLQLVADLFDVIENDAVRAAIFQPLAYSKDPRFIPIFHKGMMADGNLTRAAAIKVLIAASDPDAVHALLDLIKAGKVTVDNLNQILMEVRNQRVITPELKYLILELLQRNLKDSCLVNLLPQVARANDRGALAKLHEYLETKPVAVATAALKAIIALEPDEDLQKTLESVSEHKESTIRRAAALGLLRLGDKRAIPTLAAYLKDENQSIRLEAATAFKEHVTRAALPFLIDALLEDDPLVQKEVIEALQAHLRSFYPYRTPKLGSLGVTPGCSLQVRERVSQDLKTWLAGKVAEREKKQAERAEKQK